MKYRVEQIKNNVGVAEFEDFSDAWDFIKTTEETQLIRKKDSILLAIKTNKRNLYGVENVKSNISRS